MQRRRHLPRSPVLSGEADGDAAARGTPNRKPRARAGEFGAFDCPAGMVEAAGETLWFTDEGGISKFDEDIEDDEDEE